MGCSKSTPLKIQNIDAKMDYSQVYQMVKQGQNIVVFEDQVLDLSKYAAIHPGGKESIMYVIGKEIGRYVYGGFIIPPRTKLVIHSKKAIETMLKYKVSKIQSTLPPIFNLPPNTSLETTVWQLIKKSSITSIHNRFHFASPQVKSRNILPGIEHAGMYFTLTHINSGLKRNYGLFFTATELLLPKYLELIDVVTKGGEWTPPFEDIHNVYRDGIELFIKKKEGFSKMITEISLQGEGNYKDSECLFKLSGPYGPGLRLRPCPNGLIVAAVCGTSIAMWLEVVAYMIRKAVYEIGLKSGKDYRLFKNEVFDDLDGKNFKLILFSSFDKKEHAIGKAVFEVMANISKAHNLSNFEYYLRTTEAGDAHYTEEYLKERINGVPERIYFWGPLGVREVLEKLFLNIGYKKDTFYDV